MKIGKTFTGCHNPVHYAKMKAIESLSMQQKTKFLSENFTT